MKGVEWVGLQSEKFLSLSPLHCAVRTALWTEAEMRKRKRRVASLFAPSFFVSAM